MERKGKERKGKERRGEEQGLCPDLFTDLVTQSQSATVFCICTISFCQHFKVLYLRHDSTDIDQTWSQVPVDHPIYVI